MLIISEIRRVMIHLMGTSLTFRWILFGSRMQFTFFPFTFQRRTKIVGIHVTICQSVPSGLPLSSCDVDRSVTAIIQVILFKILHIRRVSEILWHGTSFNRKLFFNYDFIQNNSIFHENKSFWLVMVGASTWLHQSL